MAFPEVTTVIEAWASAEASPPAGWANLGGNHDFDGGSDNNTAQAATAGVASDYQTAATIGPDVCLYAFALGTTDWTGGILGFEIAMNNPSGSSNGYQLLYRGDIDGKWYIYREDAGSGTQLAVSSSAQGIAHGTDGIGIHYLGGALAMYYSSNSGTSWSQMVTATDTTYKVAGYWGLFMEGAAGAKIGPVHGGTISTGAVIGWIGAAG